MRKSTLLIPSTQHKRYSNTAIMLNVVINSVIMLIVMVPNGNIQRLNHIKLLSDLQLYEKGFSVS